MTLPNEVREAMARAMWVRFTQDHHEPESFLTWDELPVHLQAIDRFRVDAALSALEAAGWVCVPKEATPEMCIAAAQKSELRGGGLAFFKDVWTAMLTASNPKEKPDV